MKVQAAALGAAMGAVLVLSSCSGASTQHHGGPSTVTFAEQPGASPNYIFPLLSGAYFDSVNQEQFQYLMYLPLYWFGQSGQPILNTSLSLAYPPVYSHGNSVVTIRLKGWKWSNGEVVDARDVVFWMNLLKQEKTNFGPYVPGTFPDNVVSYTIVSPLVVRFNLNRGYAANWFTDNELSQITPLPLAWDRTGASSHPGNYDQSPAGAKQVYSYLIAQAGVPSNYASDPLWQVVDGPWHLSKYDASTGYVAFARNARYSGPSRPGVRVFIEEPFTSASAEFNALRSGTIDYGYIPPEDASQAGVLKRLGYSVAPWSVWGFTYVDLDYLNPTSGPIFAQPYIRQAMQSLIDQPQIIRSVYAGDAVATNGPVPLSPVTDLVSPQERKGFWPYSPSAARALLTAHGWHVIPGGNSYCEHPGTGTGECGANIPSGAKLNFGFDYVSGTVAVANEVAILQSTFRSEAGIVLSLSSEPLNALLPIATQCAGMTQMASKCSWDMVYFGAPRFLYEPDYYPTGEDIYATGAADSGDGYSNPAVDRVISATEAAGAGRKEMWAYEDAIGALVPTPFLPTPPYQLSAYKSSLTGVVPQDPLTNVYPQMW
jgi:peptide/nickel transport system substrate-binding protein